MRYVDSKKRESKILGLVVDSYIKESRPISSSYLCNKYKLPFSSATVRSVLESLERQGYLSHVHTSSGRVPTQSAFRYYVENLDREKMLKEHSDFKPAEFDSFTKIQDVFNRALELLSAVSGYTSLIGISGFEGKVSFKGTRFIFDQPEFDNVETLRNLFYTLEVKMDLLQDLLLQSIDGDMTILIGDEIGFEEISGCSLLVSGLKQEKFSLAVALLGPMRMNYSSACTSLYNTKCGLADIIKEYV